ncbi:MAG: FkbM family methyltransferase [Verrucomicrobiales bacterium]
MVPPGRLDDVASDHPDLLTASFKCDVEGFELFVFKGAEKVSAAAQPSVILEFGDYSKQGYTAEDLGKFFTGRGYELFALLPTTARAPPGRDDPRMPRARQRQPARRAAQTHGADRPPGRANSWDRGRPHPRDLCEVETMDCR